MINIALIGAGNIGSRHLQGLANLKLPVFIQVVDPFDKSLEIAKIRFDEVALEKGFNGKIDYFTTIDQIKDEIDIAIIATNSDLRREVIENLLVKKKIKNLLLEKFLFQKEEDYEVIGKLLNEYRIPAWINCPRRLYPIYKEIREKASTNRKINFTASGSGWGMCSNSVHLLDLFAFIVENSHLSLDGELFDEEVIDTKRKGFIELTGSYRGSSQNDCTFSVSCYNNGNAPMMIQISSDTFRYTIVESENGKIFSSLEEEQWQWKERVFTPLYQSGLSHIIVEQIMNGVCELTTYQESAELHLFFLELVKKHLNKITNNSVKLCPIT